ncbi:MAG: hypothetical protein ABSE79_11245 [Terriglobia bacterium]
MSILRVARHPGLTVRGDVQTVFPVWRLYCQALSMLDLLGGFRHGRAYEVE